MKECTEKKKGTEKTTVEPDDIFHAADATRVAVTKTA